MHTAQGRSPGRRQLYVAFNVTLEQSRTILVLTAFHPVTVDLESTAVNRLAQQLHDVRVVRHL